MMVPDPARRIAYGLPDRAEHLNVRYVTVHS